MWKGRQEINPLARSYILREYDQIIFLAQSGFKEALRKIYFAFYRCTVKGSKMACYGVFVHDDSIFD
jgi:hypothetical protein